MFEELAAERRHHARVPARARGHGRRERLGRTAARRTVVGRRRHRLRAVSEALLLDGRATAAAVQRTGGADRHRGPPVDRDVVAIGQATLLEVDDDARRHERGARRRTRQGRAPAGSVPGQPVRRRRPAPRRAAVPPAGSRASRWAGGSTRSTASPTARGRSWTGRPVAAPRTTIRSRRSSSTSTASRASRSGASVPRSVTLTYLYLASGEEVSHPMEDPDVGEGARRGRVAIDRRGAFDPTPGPQCTYCDFRAFCPEGKAWLAANAASAAASPLRREPLDLLLERPVARRRDRSRPR